MPPQRVWAALRGHRREDRWWGSSILHGKRGRSESPGSRARPGATRGAGGRLTGTVGEGESTIPPQWRTPHVSFGCATENLVQAALAHGLKALPQSSAGAGTDVRIAFEPTQAVASPLFAAIPKRQCTRAEFDGRPVSAEELKLLEHAGTSEGVRMILLTEKAALEKVLEYVVQGNSVQLNDPAFIAELKHWIRFDSAEAVRSGDGLYSAASGNPSVPRWLGSMLFGMLFTAARENKKYAKDIRSSAGIAVFVSQADGKTAQAANRIEVGRCYERFASQAAALGIRNASINQPVEGKALRPQFATYLGVGDRRPDLVVRFGRGPELPKSLRRPLAAVLV